MSDLKDVYTGILLILKLQVLARRGSTIGFHLLWHTVELAMSTHLCLL